MFAGSGGSLRVRIVSARGLRAADWSLTGGRSSDPYVVCEIPGKPISKFQTAVIPKTLNPVWNHEQDLQGYGVGDSISFEVYDKDVGKSDDFLGKLVLSSAQIHPSGFDGELPLSQAGRGVKAFLRVQIAPAQQDVTGGFFGGGGVPAGAGGVWSCPRCTFDNPADAQVCQVCEGPRPATSGPNVGAGAGLGMPPTPGPPLGQGPGQLGGQAGGPVTPDGPARAASSSSLGTSSSFPPFQAAMPGRPGAAGPGGAFRPGMPLGPRGSPTASGSSLGGGGLQVLIESARGLRAADWSLTGSSSDPYCICEIVGKPRSKVQTQTIEKTLTPVWNYSAELRDWREGDSLAFTVYDKDWGKSDDLLGKLTLVNDQFWPGGFEGELPLSECGSGHQAFLKIKVIPPQGAGGPWETPSLSFQHSQSFTPSAGTADPRSAWGLGAPALGPGGASAGPAGGLKVTIVRAGGLRAADVTGSSDPYCVCEVLNKPQTKFQTPHIDKTLEPVWNHQGYISDFTSNDTLAFTVYDHDWGKTDDLLGKAMLTSSQIPPGGFDGALTLTEAGRGSRNAFVAVRVEPYQPSRSNSLQPEMGQGFVSSSQALKVVIVGARGLRAVESFLRGGKSEPFCVCEIPGKPQASLRTPVVGKTLEPTWNHAGELLDFSPGDSLSFAIYHQGGSKADELLGRLNLPPSSFHPGGFEGELPLTDAGKNAKAFLRIRVFPAGAGGQQSPLYPGMPAGGGALMATVTVEGARGLRHGSPYVTVEVPGKPQARFRTAVLDRTPNPVWNHVEQIRDFSPGDSLTFIIQDAMKRDEVLGRLILTSSQMFPNGFRGELPLTDVGRGGSAVLGVSVQFPAGGQFGPGAGRAWQQGGAPLKIFILAARGLQNNSWFGYPDPYCECQMQGKPYSRVRTAVVRSTLDPLWNHEADIYDWSWEDTLELVVRSASAGSGEDQALGMATLSGAQLQGFEGEVPLLLNGQRSGAFLKLRISGQPFLTASELRLARPRPQQSTLECGLLATAFSILSGVPAGLPSDAKPLAKALPPSSPSSGPALQGRGGPWTQGPREQMGMRVANVLDSLSESYRNAGNLEEALVQSKKALDIRVDAFGDRHPDTAASYSSIGTALRLQDRLDEAWQCHWRALEIRLQERGEWHADTAASYTCLGAILLQQGDIENALEYYSRALDISRQILGELHPDTAACCNDVGAVFERKGDLGNALQYLLRALEIQRQLVGARHPTLGDAYNNVGAVLWQEGRLSEALEHHQRAIEIRMYVLGDRHPDTALSYGNVGVILEQLGRYPEALEYQQKALEVRLAALGQQHSETAASQINLGVVLERLSRYEEALGQYRQAHSVLLAAVGARHPWTEQAQQRAQRCQRSWRNNSHSGHS